MNERPLPVPVRQLLREQEPETRLQPIWRGISRRRARVLSRPRLARTLALACALAVLAIAWGLWRVRQPAPPQRVQYRVIPAQIVADAKPAVHDLGDGAEVTVGPDTRLDVLRQTTTQMLLALRHGNAHFDIRPGGARAWVIECGGAAVEVVGTRFTLDRNEQRLSVKVQRGRVLVRGELVPDTVQSLAAGQEITLAYTDARQAALETSAPAQPAAEHPEPTAVQVPSRQASADWRSAAQQRDWQRAWHTLGEDGVGREASRSDDVSDLLALADVARLSGHPRQAVLPLQQVMTHHWGIRARRLPPLHSERSSSISWANLRQRSARSSALFHPSCPGRSRKIRSHGSWRPTRAVTIRREHAPPLSNTGRSIPQVTAWPTSNVGVETSEAPVLGARISGPRPRLAPRGRC